MILGILFYLMQAHEYLQEGVTYKLGCSFYLARIGVFLFLMTGLGWGGVGFGVWACVQGCRWGQGGIGFGMGRGLWAGRIKFILRNMRSQCKDLRWVATNMINLFAF